MASVFDKIKRFFTVPKYRFQVLQSHGFLNLLGDKTYLKYAYRINFGKKLNLKHPVTLNEKIQWLKLYNRDPRYTEMVDKAAVKDYVARTIGEEYIIPTLGVYDSFDEIDFDALPEQFVLKCTHDSGGLAICTDKATFDYAGARTKIENSLKRNYYRASGREWVYKDVKPRIIAEQYMVDESGYELKDYKFFCFNGTAQMMFIASDRQVQGEETKFDFFDMDFNHLPFTNGHPNATHEIKCPASFTRMRALAEMLATGIPLVRVDFYDINGRIYFGEITFFHFSGMVPFNPPEWDEKLGNMLTLPEKPKKKKGS